MVDINSLIHELERNYSGEKDRDSVNNFLVETLEPIRDIVRGMYVKNPNRVKANDSFLELCKSWMPLNKYKDFLERCDVRDVFELADTIKKRTDGETLVLPQYLDILIKRAKYCHPDSTVTYKNNGCDNTGRLIIWWFGEKYADYIFYIHIPGYGTIEKLVDFKNNVKTPNFFSWKIFDLTNSQKGVTFVTIALDERVVELNYGVIEALAKTKHSFYWSIFGREFMRILKEDTIKFGLSYHKDEVPRDSIYRMKLSDEEVDEITGNGKKHALDRVHAKAGVYGKSRQFNYL